MRKQFCIMLVGGMLAFWAQSGWSDAIDIGDFSYSYNLSTEEATITKYNGSAASVTIPSTISIPETYKDSSGETHTRHHTVTVTGIGSSAFQNNATIKFISFNDKLKSIGDSAFSGCAELRSVRTPVTLTLIGSSAFANCPNLVEAEINGTGLSLNSALFGDCGNLRCAVFGDGVTRLYNSYMSGAWGVNTRSGTFGTSPNLQFISVGSGVTEVPCEFTTGCGGSSGGLSVSFSGPIKIVNSNAFSNNSVTNLDLTFANCEIGSKAFSGCPANMDKLDFTQVKSIGTMRSQAVLD